MTRTRWFAYGSDPVTTTFITRSFRLATEMVAELQERLARRYEGGTTRGAVEACCGCGCAA